MKAEEKIICDYAAKFINKNFDRIEYNLEDSNFPTNKGKFLSKVKNNVQNAIWVITELAAWGMDKAYLKHLYVELDEGVEFTILKIDDKYIKLTVDDQYIWTVKFVEPKEKTVIYFD